LLRSKADLTIGHEKYRTIFSNRKFYSLFRKVIYPITGLGWVNGKHAIMGPPVPSDYPEFDPILVKCISYLQVGGKESRRNLKELINDLVKGDEKSDTPQTSRGSSPNVMTQSKVRFFYTLLYLSISCIWQAYTPLKYAPVFNSTLFICLSLTWDLQGENQKEKGAGEGDKKMGAKRVSCLVLQ